MFNLMAFIYVTHGELDGLQNNGVCFIIELLSTSATHFWIDGLQNNGVCFIIELLSTSATHVQIDGLQNVALLKSTAFPHLCDTFLARWPSKCAFASALSICPFMQRILSLMAFKMWVCWRVEHFSTHAAHI
jgi:hypothetical protein